MVAKIDRVKKLINDRDYNAAIKMLISLDFKNNKDACYLLGTCVEEFNEMEEKLSEEFLSSNDCEYRTAYDIFLRACALDSKDAHYRLSLYEKLLNYGSHTTESIFHLRHAADLGHARACFECYVEFYDSFNLDQSINSLIYLNKAVEFNDPDAINALGNRYLYGNGEKKDPLKAKQIFTRLLFTNSKEYLKDFGVKLLVGECFKPDYELAYKCFKRLVELDSEYGYLYLGYMYEYAVGVDKNIDKALKCYNVARSINCNDVYSTYQMAMIYSTKEYENLGKAYIYFQALVDDGFFAKIFKYDEKEEYNRKLFKIYSVKSDKVSQAIKEKVIISKIFRRFKKDTYRSKCFSKLYVLYLLGDYKSSCYNLAKLFQKGYPILSDEKYLELLNVGANALDIKCILELADYYKDEPKKVLQIYKKGVDKLDPVCLCKYAIMLYNGIGCRKQTNEARIYFKLAIELKCEEAINFCKENGEII